MNNRLIIIACFALLFIVTGCATLSNPTGSIENEPLSACDGTECNTEEYSVSQGTVLRHGDLSIGIISTTSDTAFLDIMVASTGENQKIKLNEGEEISIENYLIKNVESEQNILPSFMPGQPSGQVILRISKKNESNESETNNNDEYNLLSIDDIKAELKKIDEMNDKLITEVIELQTGERTELSMDEHYVKILGIDQRNVVLVKAVYICEDLCPKNGKFVIFYEDVKSEEECVNLGGTPLLSIMDNGIIGCKVRV